MRVLTTGGSGFAGRYLLETLVQNGFSVVNLVHNNKSGIKGVEEYRIASYSVEFFKNKTKGVDIIVHLAAALGSSKGDYEYFYKINTDFPEKLILGAIDSKVKKFIYVSSAGVYGKGSKKPIDEKVSPQPVDNYEKTKFFGEKAVLKYKNKVDVIVLRPGWIYGPNDKRTLKLYKTINTGKFFIAGKGDGKQTPIFVNDFINAILLTIKKDIKSGEIFNIAGDEQLTIEQMVKIIANILGKKILPFKVPLTPLIFISHILDFINDLTGISFPVTRSSLAFFERSKPLSIEKAKNLLGFLPKTRFEDGMKETLKWYKDRGLL